MKLLPLLQPRTAALALAGATSLALAACSSSGDAPRREDPAPVVTPAPRPAAVAPATSGETWNAANIEWLPFAEGLERAKAQNKPICLVIYTTWCPHCKNFSKVFDDPRVVERAKEFVMIRLDGDKESDVAGIYVKDGGYIPRTFFLSPDGTPDFSIHAPRPSYMYFYDEKNPASLLAGMSEASLKLHK